MFVFAVLCVEDGRWCCVRIVEAELLCRRARRSLCSILLRRASPRTQHLRVPSPCSSFAVVLSRVGRDVGVTCGVWLSSCRARRSPARSFDAVTGFCHLRRRWGMGRDFGFACEGAWLLSRRACRSPARSFDAVMEFYFCQLFVSRMGWDVRGKTAGA